MKITYIYHSSFCVEFEEEKIALIFDYYKGDFPPIDKSYAVFMFASHKHFDHFSKKIFDLTNDFPNITFILSKDIKMNTKYMDRLNVPTIARDKIQYVTYLEQYHIPFNNQLGNLAIQTLKSTDEGVAFIVECAGKRIYHAGDLNWWIWNGLTEKENTDMTERFVEQIEKIEGETFDVAFLPLDPRQEDKFYWGFDYFMKKCNVTSAFPMHLWDKYETIEEFKKMEITQGYENRVMEIAKEGQVFLI